tara:strand:+ start:403 stop:1218 length:816 start_codon:yes stop_codon:yes gene_type:complete
MSSPYTDYPVYIGGTASNQFVPAIDVSVDYTSAAQAKRKLGTNIGTTDQFGYNRPLDAKISINSIVHTGMESGFAFLQEVDRAKATTIRLGDIDFNDCYATDVSVKIKPFEPVTIQSNFICLNPETGTQIKGTNPYNLDMSGDGVAYGYACSVNDQADVLNNVQSEIQFTRRYLRTPSYTLGSIGATSMFLDEIEEELVITSTGLESLINYSGDVLTDTLDVAINSVGIGITTPITDLISFKEGATVDTENFFIRGGETLQTSATIKQATL